MRMSHYMRKLGVFRQIISHTTIYDVMLHPINASINLLGCGAFVQNLNPVIRTNTYLPPSFGRSTDLPMMRYDLPFTNPKCSLQLGRAKNCLTFPSTSSSVPTGQKRRQFYRDIPNVSRSSREL